MLQSATEREPDAQEAAHAKRLHERIKHFDGLQDERRKKWKKARTYVDGNPGEDGSSGLVRVNMIGSFVETIQANIYAKAPEIAVTPEDRPDETEYPALTAVGKTVQTALNTWLVKDGDLKRRGKSAVRAAITCTTGWVKVLYQREKGREPIVRNNINDIQDNIARIERLREEVADDSTDHEAELVSLRQQEQALTSQPEVVLSEGMVVDHVPTEDIIILDASVRDIDEAPQSSAIAHRIKMTGAAFKNRFKVKPPSKGVEEPQGESNVDDDDKIVIVYEVWSKDDNTVYTLCKGENRWIQPPYQPPKLGDRWYPFFALQLRRVDGVLYPLSLVELLIELQDEYNTRHTRASEHRRKNLPVRLVNKSSSITDEEINAINNRRIGTDVVGVSADPTLPLGNQLASMPEIPFNPAMYDVSDVMRDMEMVAGVQDASRGAINKAKTATEAEIMAQGMQSRSSEVIDTVEEWLTDIAKYAAHLLMLELTADQVKERLGQSAMWPELTAREQLKLLGITIRSGSTARPNKMRERDQWIQLMPMMQEALQKSAELEQTNPKLARAILKILQETLNRFDEKLDIKQFLGIELAEDGEEADLPPEVMQQMEQGKALIEELQAKLQQAGEALKSRVDEMNLERDKAQTAAQATIDSDRTKAEIAADADVEKARIAAVSAENVKRLEVAGQLLVSDQQMTIDQALQAVDETVQALLPAEPLPPLEPMPM